LIPIFYKQNPLDKFPYPIPTPGPEVPWWFDDSEIEEEDR